MHPRLAKMLSLAHGLAGLSARPRPASPAVGPDRIFPVPTGEDGAWIAQARRLPAFTCDAVFAIEPSVHLGPDGGLSLIGPEAARITLPPVDLPRRYADRASTEEVLGREAALIAHYRRILAIAAQHDRIGSLQPFPFFRSQPAIMAEGRELASFPWTDDLHETGTVLEAFVEAACGPPRLVHVDQDQGWGLLVVASGTATCLMEWDAEGPPPADGGYAFDAASLAGQAAAALERLAIIHARLVDAVGRDYWTHSPPQP